METNIEARRGEGSGISGLNPEVRAFVLAVAFTLGACTGKEPPKVTPTTVDIPSASAVVTNNNNNNNNNNSMPELEKIEYEKAVAMEIDDLPYDGDGNSNNVKLLLRLAYVLGVDMSSYLDKNKQYVNDRDNFILLKEDVIIAQSKASIAESKASIAESKASIAESKASIARIKQEMESEREQALKNLLNAIESNGSKS